MKPRIVIKLGGSALQNSITLRELATLVSGYHRKNYAVIVVHGGGPAINQELTKRGIRWKFINGQRQTTPEMIEVIENVLAKEVNSTVVASLYQVGTLACGLSGAEDHILYCRPANPELMQVGEVEHVDTTSIEKILASEGVPVIAPIGIDCQGKKFNINADWAAAKIAIALHASQLIFLTDQNGILDQQQKLVRVATPLSIHNMIEEGVISGGMCTKVLAMMTALAAGIEQVRVLHASAARHLLSRYKVGTLLVPAQASTVKEVMHGHAS